MADQSETSVRLPIVEEQFHVERVVTPTDHVRVTTHVRERHVVAEETLESGDFEVARIAVDREVSEAPKPRQDGDTFIVSLVEERLVTEKKLFVVEEVRIRRTSTLKPVSIPVTLRSTHARVEHDVTGSQQEDMDG